ncbi:MAG: DegT/DnrJ/EryC1/StrS aminotransferase family protein [Alphaproteobacteria bacterium]|nr:DegT/DnrJ/EryC1/StrS aminotransferase family protein [Alphaproteobacteria bacterium]
MNERTIPFGRPMMDQAEIDLVVKVLQGTTMVHGPMTHQFEHRFAERVGARHAISVSSCTAALHLSLFAQDVGTGDEVVVPALTHVATAHVAELCGAKPVFVDVEPETGNIDAKALPAAVGERTRAVMVVHFLGLPCDMDRITPIADKAGAFVVEDCAIALDATYGNRKVGTLGASGCFSFYPIKHITTIEGGMVTTNDSELAARVAQRKSFGYDKTVDKRTKPGIYDVTALGFNYRMNEVEAAVGLAQMDKLDRFQSARTRNYRELQAALQEVDEVTVFQPVRGKASSTHYCLNAVLPRDGSIDRDAVVADLNKQGVGTSVHYPGAVPLMTYYREKYGYKAGQFPVAEWLAAQTVSLPVGPHVEPGEPARIGRAVRDAVQRARR